VLSQKIEPTLPFTAMEVVLLGRAPWRAASSREQDIAVAVAAMNECGVARFADRAYTSLSGGEQQRVHLARVLGQIWHRPDGAAPDERYLFLDEPTASLDLAHQHSTLAVARRFAAGGVGVVAVLHDLNLAAMYADRLLLMKGGRAVAEGTADRVLEAGLLESVFDLPLAVSRHPTRGCPQVSAV
jgi:iron complex transport system ATP-binding protein